MTELEWSACHERGTPALIEDGMTVTHQLENISPSGISAQGWDGSSADVSEEANGFCSNARIAWCRIPESVEFEWL